MKRDLVVVGLTAVLAIVVYRMIFPPKVVEKQIPHIITKFDTVKVMPSWLNDSIKKWKSPKVVHTTDTVNLVLTNTIVDTQIVHVDAPPAQRENIWPLLNYHSRGGFGDTAIVSTFSLRTGQLGVSRVFTAGYLTAIDVDSNSVPKMTFMPFPKPKGVGFFTKLFYGSVGYGACSLVSLVKP